MFFSNKKIEEQEEIEAISSSLGKPLTSISLASKELQKDLKSFNPLDFINGKKLYFGLDFLDEKTLIKLPIDDVTHSIIVGPTRTGKGVLATAKIVESLRRGRGVVVIDPKQDDFLPQAIFEELERQNRSEDLLIANFPNDFGYSGFEDTDTPTVFANKVTAMLDLFDIEDNPGASYYRRNERVFLHRIIFLFFNSEKVLNIEFSRNWKSLINFVKYIYKDLENETLYFKEITKMKPNSELIDRFSKRFFNPKLFEKLEFNEQDLATAKGLYQTLSEFYDINIYTKYSVKQALFEGKVLYIKSDMLDSRALKHLKLLINDIIIQSKKFRGAKCDVYADELSFYPTSVLSGALATIAGFGVHFTLMYQDDSQLSNESLKKAMKSNCQLKIYYKSSDLETLEYIEKIGGLHLVNKARKVGSVVASNQEQEALFNITRLRAMPRQFIGVMISESLSEPKILQSYFVPTKGKFNWEIENEKITEVEKTTLELSYSILEVDNYDDDNTYHHEVKEVEVETVEEDF